MTVWFCAPQLLNWWEAFFRTGSIIFGGGQVRSFDCFGRPLSCINHGIALPQSRSGA